MSRAAGLFIGALAAIHALCAAQTPLGPAPITNAGDTGRIAAIACHPTLPGRYFAAAADGGVWRTDDSGASWSPLTDHLPGLALGAITLDPTNPNIIYVGTGEANFANHSRYGVGIFKSLDAGATWTHLGQNEFAGRCISRLIVDPALPTRVYAAVTHAGGFPALAAAKGHPGAAGPLGLFRSDDAGDTWTALTSLPDLSVTDLAMSPDNPAVLYACVGHIFGDDRNGIYKSLDAGATWTRLAGGLPTTLVGRIALAVAPSDPSRLYALFATRAQPDGSEASTLGAFRSDNAGSTWTQIPAGQIQASYGWYLCTVGVKPDDPNTVIFGGVQLVRSTSAGSTFATITPPHVDMHAVTWDAAGRLVVGDDGGVHRSTNLGTTWTALNSGLGAVQFYAGLSTHPVDDERFLGGTQDNGTNLRSGPGLTWTRVTGGDGGWTQWDQSNPLRLFTELQGTANVYLSTNGGQSFAGTGRGIDRADRNCFLPPYLIEPGNPQRMLYATHRVYRSTDSGANWTAISDDLTADLDEKAAIRALAISPADVSTVYAVTNNHRFLASTDAGASFDLRPVEARGWPRTTREVWLDTSDPATVYLAGATFGAPHVRRSQDRGITWQVLDGDLPDLPVNVVAADTRCAPPVLFAGSDSGLYRSTDDGQTWTLVGGGLPRACVIDLKLEPARGRLIVSTQGRGAWVLSLPPTCPPSCDPDYNRDGNIDQDDIALLVGVVAGGQNPTGRNPDFNRDGNVDQDDVAALVGVIAGGDCP
ncbi:MAG: hypothetical protein DYG92_13225 [Leptolyngbya sp. PLA1]|nr:hypothetical protein [Leptolyngbya sp. PLA1]